MCGDINVRVALLRMMPDAEFFFLGEIQPHVFVREVVTVHNIVVTGHDIAVASPFIDVTGGELCLSSSTPT